MPGVPGPGASHEMVVKPKQAAEKSKEHGCHPEQYRGVCSFFPCGLPARGFKEQTGDEISNIHGRQPEPNLNNYAVTA